MQQTEDERFRGGIEKVVITHSDEDMPLAVLEQLTYSKTGQLLEQIHAYSNSEATKTTFVYDEKDRKICEETCLIETQIVTKSLRIEYKNNQTITELIHYDDQGKIERKHIKTEEDFCLTEHCFDKENLLTETVISIYIQDENGEELLLKERKTICEKVVTSFTENIYSTENLLLASKSFYINYEGKEINHAEKMRYNNDGKLIEKVSWVDGMIVSTYLVVYEKGVLREELYLDKNGNPSSKTNYNETGHEISSEYWNDGKLESLSSYSYHENGESKERNVLNKDGVTTFSILVDEQGRTYRETTFDEISGEIIKQKNFVFKVVGNQKEVWEYTQNKELRYHKINTMDENDNVIRHLEEDVFYNSTIDQHYDVNGLLLRESIINGMDNSIHCTEIEYDEFLNEICISCTLNGKLESMTKTVLTYYSR